MTMTKNQTYFPFLVTIILATIAFGTVPAQAAFVKVFTNEHVDIEGEFEGGQLVLGVHDDDNDIHYDDPSSVQFLISESLTRSGLSSNSTYDFLGVAPGAEIFVLPAGLPTFLFGGSQTPDVPFVGLANGARPMFSSLNFDFDPTEFTGPGRFSLFTDSGVLLMSSELTEFNGASVPNSAGSVSHTHYNFAFSAPGNYVLPFRVRGTPSGGSELTSEWVNLNIHAVPEPTSFALMGIGAGVFGLALRRRKLRQAKGEESLTA